MTYEDVMMIRKHSNGKINISDLNELHELIDKAIEKQISKKQKRYNRCPICGSYLDYADYCPSCGQAIDWSDEYE